MSGRYPRNYPGIFNLFAHEKPDRRSSTLKRIGQVGFTIAFAIGLIGTFIRDERSVAYAVMIISYGVAAFTGIFMFIAVGIHYAGREKGKNTFLSSTLYVLRNVFLFLLLPCLIITAALITWAVLTNRPVFE